jgi:hypothetical protein
MHAEIDKPQPRSTRGGNYWTESKRPLVSLAFILPLLVIYEVGVLALGPRAVHNGADVWMRRLLDFVGFGQYFLLPLLTVSLLLAWHHVSHDRWRVSPTVLYGMCLESSLLGLLLVGIAYAHGYVQRSLLEWSVAGQLAAALDTSGSGAATTNLLARVIGFFGAGIYEEVLFRLLLLPLVTAAIKLCGVRPPLAVAGAVILTSLAFSVAHYIGPHGETLGVFSFLFRLVAGGFFALLFVYRGFGIAAGTHALYDIFVTFLPG